MRSTSSILSVVVVLTALTSIAWGQFTHVETNITVQNEKGKFSTVLCGVDTGATNGLDIALGEFAIPGFPPQPAGLQSALVFRDNGGAILSYRDFRPLGKTRVFTDTFTLMLTPATDVSRGDTVFFRWAFPLDQNIDSIIISDFFDGSIKRIFLDKRESDTLFGNSANLENFRVIVHYNIKDPVSVSSDLESPSPTNSIVALTRSLQLPEPYRSASAESYAHVYNLSGQEVAKFQPSSFLDLEDLTSGAYFLLIDQEHDKPRLAIRMIKP